MDDAELPEFDTQLPKVHVHYDFRPIKIRVYRNGDENDLGKDFFVTRKEFKHWIFFLDVLTKKLGTTTAINKLYTVLGERIDHFDDLIPKGEYVAVEKNGFVPCDYGKYRLERSQEKKWKSTLHAEEDRLHFLNSAETMDIYLKNEGYGSYTGLPYPHDSILANSHSHSAMHIHSHVHVEQYGGSLEKLNKVGRTVFHEENVKEHSKSEIHLPKLVGLTDPSSSDLTEKDRPQAELKLPQIVKTAATSSEETLPTEIRVSEESPGPEKSTIVEEKKKEETLSIIPKVDEIYEENGHIIVPLMISTKYALVRSPGASPQPKRREETEELPLQKDISPFITRKLFDADLDTVKPLRRPRAIEQIVEKTERRIYRELSDDRDHIMPPKEVPKNTSSYKTSLWEKRRFDPDFD